jgi:hypothetical protein
MSQPTPTVPILLTWGVYFIFFRISGNKREGENYLTKDMLVVLQEELK